MHPNLSIFPYGFILNLSVKRVLHLLSCTFSAMGGDQERTAWVHVVFLIWPLLAVYELVETSHLEGKSPWFSKVTSCRELGYPLCHWFPYCL